MKNGRLIFAVALGVCACSSSPSGPNIDSNKTLVALSASDQKALCDWQAGQYGGYGKSISCGGGLTVPMKGPTDQATCVSGLPQPQPSPMPSCQATVGQFETCVKWKVSNGCGSGSGMPPAECADVRGTGC